MQLHNPLEPISSELSKRLPAALDFAQGLAREAGRLALQSFGGQQAVDWKPDDSPVTATDRLIERHLRTAIAARYPGHAILGEEEGHAGPPADRDFCWILDPIDGTRSFARGIPVFGVQLALAWQGRPVLGVIELPALGESIAAATGLGCRFNGSACRVSGVADPARAMIHVHERDLARARSPRLGPWLEGVQLERNWGDCYSFVLVATGRAEAALDPRMQVWDNGPLPVLLREAGGMFCDWSGRDSIWSGSAVATNAAIGPQILHLLEADDSLVL